MREELRVYVILIFIVGVFAGILTFGMIALFGYSGEKLTFRIRTLAFKTMLKQVNNLRLHLTYTYLLGRLHQMNALLNLGYKYVQPQLTLLSVRGPSLVKTADCDV